MLKLKLTLLSTLASAYTPAVSKSVTQTYLSELKEEVKQTGRDLAAVLREELSVISEAVDLDNTETQNGEIRPNSLDTPEQHVPEATAQVSPPSSTVCEPYVQPECNWSPLLAPSERKTLPPFETF